MRDSDERYSFRKVVVKDDDEAKMVEAYNRETSKDHKSTQRYNSKRKPLPESVPAPRDELSEEEDESYRSPIFQKNFVIRYLKRHTTGQIREIGLGVLVRSQRAKDYAAEKGLSYGHVRNIVSMLKTRLKKEYERQLDKHDSKEVCAMLVDFYKKPEKVDALISPGDLSELERNVSPDPRQKHNFKVRQSHACVFYGRDKGDYTHGPRKMKAEDFKGVETYVFKDRKWFYVRDGQETEVETYLEEFYRKYGFERPKGFYGYLRDVDIRIFKSQYEEKERQKAIEIQKEKAKEAAEFGF